MKCRLLFVAITTLILVGCAQRPAPIIEQPGTEVSTAPVTEIVEKPPKTQSIHWQTLLSPLVSDLIAQSDIDPGVSLLVNDAQNSTNGYIATSNITNTLRHQLEINARYIIISQNRINQAKRVLGIATDDSLSSRSKAIGLARYLQAQYVLYTTVTGEVEQPTVSLQLMLVNTGEIVWSQTAKGE